MSEPEDQDTDAPGEDADLDELLEQFREEELPPKKKPGPVWHILAFILICLAFGLAVRASRAPLQAHRATSGKMMPTKVRDRSLTAPRDLVDAKADYEERCRKGMTVTQVRWVVEDFRNAGLGEGPGSLMEQYSGLLQGSVHDENGRLPGDIAAKGKSIALSLGNLQRLWYLSALGDGLSLDSAQKGTLKTRLAGAFSKDVGQLDKFPLDMNLEQWEAAFGLFLTPGRWLEDEEYAPWSLCDLSDGQMAVTGQKNARNPGNGDEGEGSQASSWFEYGQRGGNEVVTRETIDAILARPRRWGFEPVFPRTGDQDFSDLGDDVLEVAERLHPAQLKMLLLLNPALAGNLMEALSASGE